MEYYNNGNRNYTYMFFFSIFQAKAFKLRFNLKHDTKLQRHLSLLWEKTFLALMESDNVKTSANTVITFATSESLDMELAEHTSTDTKFFALTIIIMVSGTIDVYFLHIYSRV